MRKKNQQNNIQQKVRKKLIHEETKHNHIIPNRILKKLEQGGKRTFQKLKKKVKPCDKKRS